MRVRKAGEARSVLFDRKEDRQLKLYADISTASS
jgi:hypothetical protein